MRIHYSYPSSLCAVCRNSASKGEPGQGDLTNENDSRMCGHLTDNYANCALFLTLNPTDQKLKTNHEINGNSRIRVRRYVPALTKSTSNRCVPTPSFFTPQTKQNKTKRTKHCQRKGANNHNNKRLLDWARRRVRRSLRTSTLRATSTTSASTSSTPVSAAADCQPTTTIMKEVKRCV